MKSLTIVIVNWNSGLLLLNCIKSIYNNRRDNFVLDKLIIVDNDSSDNSLAGIDSINLPLKIIFNKENLGFAKGCNIGAEDVKSDFILFLNPDTILYEDTLSNLFKAIIDCPDERIAIYGIQLHDRNGKIQRTCSRFPTIWNLIVSSLGLYKFNSKIFKTYRMREWNHINSTIVDEVMGAFFMVKSNLFFKVKGFDERYFVYFEELDFSKKIFDLGYKSKYVVESQACHEGFGSSDNIKGLRLYYNLKSRIIYSLKHFGKIKGGLIIFSCLIIEPFTRLVFLSFKKKTSKNIFDLFLGYKILFSQIFKIIKIGLIK